MRQYKYSSKSGALNEAAMPLQQAEPLLDEGVRTRSVIQRAPSLENVLQEAEELPEDSYAAAHSTGVHDFRELRGLLGDASAHAQATLVPEGAMAGGARPGAASGSSLDTTYHEGRWTMFFYTIEEGQRVLVTHRSGKVEIVKGPAKIARFGKRFRSMEHHIAHPGEFLIVRFRDGSQEHLAGPAHLWLDPREHLAVSKEDCIQISEKEAIVVYSKADDDDDGGGGGGGKVSRRIISGPEDFVPKPGEWLHTFSWHGSKGGVEGYRKVPNALVFQKLWLLPDQMYHDIPDVRTADGVVITIRLMLFFELVDIETMLVTTHDPIGDFVNAATSDVVEFIGKLDFEAFKGSTEKLNDLGTYRQLVSRAESCGYRINKVVYRGYGAPAALQKMHEQAMESRTKLQLEKATEEQAQGLADFQLERRLAREVQEAKAVASHQEQELGLERRQATSRLESAREHKEFERQQKRLDKEQQRALEQAQNQQIAENLERLRELGVDLTRYLTQGRADRVIELRGGNRETHLHLSEEFPDHSKP